MNEYNVSVVIPNYNRTETLRRALASLKAQSLRPNEVIVVDDYSAPNKLQEVERILREFDSDLNIILLLNNQNKGANYSRNRGLWSASSSYVAFLDSDDFWMPSKLEVQMNCIMRAKNSDTRPVLSATGRYRIDDYGDIIARQFGGFAFNTAKITLSNFIGTLSSVVVDSAAAKEVMGFNEALCASQDWDFFIRLSDRIQYVGVDEPLCVYADHSDVRITSNSKRRIMAHMQMRKMHLNFPGYPEVSMSALAGVMAEDFQNYGNLRVATMLYAKNRYSRKSKLFQIFIPEWIFTCMVKRWGAPKLKLKRYARYARSLEKYMQNPARRAIVEVDQRTIKRMISQ